MKHAILFVLFLLSCGRLSAQIVECDTMGVSYNISGIVFEKAILVAADSMITVPMINNTSTNFAYPQIKLINTTPLPTGMSLENNYWSVFASAWNIGDTATAHVDYVVNNPIPDNYTVSFKLYVTNFMPLSIDSCVFVQTLTVNLKPVAPSRISEVNTPMSFSFYPNPAKDRIMISTAAETIVEICAISGAVVHTVAISRHASDIDISSLPAGVYFLREKRSGVVRKLIKVE